MRIVTGVARGRKIAAPPGPARPTTDRVREAVFSMLEARGAVEGAHVADLFAGSGAMGMEALSRGAASAVFVDNDSTAVATIRANLATTGLDGKAEVISSDVPGWVGQQRGSPPWDLVFCDPPYAFDRWTELAALLAAVIPTGLWVAESDRPVGGDEEAPTLPGWDVLKVRRHGSTVVSVMCREESGLRE